jgi:hypothetical protein
VSIDILSLDEAKQALSQDSLYSENDTLLSGYISSVSRRLDQVCGPIVQRTVTGELYDGRGHTIWLRQRPLASVTQVIEYDKAVAETLTEDTNSVSPADGFRVDLKSGTITRMISGVPYKFVSGIQNIRVTYIAGRYTDTANVDPLFKIAAQAFLAHVWKTNQGMGTQTFSYDGATPTVTYALPNRVKDLLGDEIQTPGIG